MPEQLTRVERTALRYLVNAQTPLTRKALALYPGMSHSGTYRAVERLRHKGMVCIARPRGPENGAFIAPTDEGIATIGQLGAEEIPDAR